MSARPIGIGIIGVAPQRSWSAIAHIPALQALPSYRIAALSTTNQASADRAAALFGIEHAFDNHLDLVTHPDVQLVVVTVKVPDHAELVEAALRAGKMVYCEWPLARDLEEARQLTQLADELNVTTLIGLQACQAPEFAYARDLIAQGYVGTVLSATLVGSGLQWGDHTQPANAYTADKSNGATLLSIPLGHTLDAVCSLLGEITEVSASLSNRRTSIAVEGEPDAIPLTAEDQIIAACQHASGAVTAIHYRGGSCRGTNFLLEINGSDGDLRLTAEHGHAQMSPLQLYGGQGDQQILSPLPLPEAYQLPAHFPTGPAQNVALLYDRFAQALHSGTELPAQFSHALQRHRLLDAIQRSSDTGRRIRLI